MVDQPTLYGTRSRRRERYVMVSQDEIKVPVPLTVLTGSSASVAAYLAKRGIYLIGPEMIRRFMAEVASLSIFKEGDLADRIGWNEPSFLLPDGEPISPKGSSPIVAVDAVSGKCATAGTLRRWKRTVAKLLAEQSLAKFLLLLPFMPPILQLSSRADNFGFELVGPKGVGKSTIQAIVASVVGSPGRGSDSPYVQTWDTTLNATEEVMPAHADMLLILDEAALFFADESKTKRAAAFKAFAFKAAAGSTKKRLGANNRTSTDRFAYLSSSNMPLMELLGDGSETSRAAADRLITIDLQDNRPHGIFDCLPDEYQSGSEYAAALMSVAVENHGTAIRRFVRRLVEARAKDEKGLRAHISAYVDAFIQHSEVDLNDGSAVRVAEAFGLVYAAGRLASEYGALPKQFGCGRATVAAYRLHKAGNVTVSFVDQLEEIAKRSDTEVIADGVRGLRPKRLASARAILKYKGTQRLLIIRSRYIEVYFPDWRSRKRRSDVRGVLRIDGRHLQTPEQLSLKGGREKAFVFLLPVQTPAAEEDDDA